MKIEEKDLELINRYFDHDLSETDETLFNKKMDESEAFRNEVLFTEGLIATVHAVEKDNDINQIKDLFREFDREENRTKTHEKPAGKVIQWPVVFAVAASLLLLICAGVIFLNNYTENDMLAMYEQHYESFPLGITRNGSQDIAYELYSAGKFAESIPFLLRLREDSASFTTDLALANAYLKVDSIGRAEIILLSMLPEDKILKQYRDWYLGFTYLKAENKEKAIEQFRNLVQNNSQFSERSGEILSRITD